MITSFSIHYPGPKPTATKITPIYKESNVPISAPNPGRAVFPRNRLASLSDH